MLLSRFWYLVLAVAAGASLAMAMLTKGMFNREYVERTEESLMRDRMQIESLLKIDARTRLDAIAPIAADGEVRDGLRNAARGKSTKDARKRLRSLNKQLAGLKADLLIAVGSDGQIAMQVGRKQPKDGAGLGAVPVVEAALAGYMADDTWVYNGSVYRVAARPVVDSGRYTGAIVHAQRFDAQLAQILSERLGGATVGFFFRDRVIASYAPTDVVGAPTQDNLEAGLSEALQDEKLQQGERSEPVDLEGTGRAVYSLVAGSASDVQVGYVIARPYTVLTSPLQVFDRTTAEDVDQLPLALLITMVLLGVGIGLGLVYVERDRPIRTFRADLDSIIAGQADEVDIGAQRGAYRRLAEAVNDAIEKSVERRGGEGKKHKADLDKILGPAEASTSSAFSFGGSDEEAEPAAAPAPMAMPAPEPKPMPAPQPPPAAKPPPPASAPSAPKPPPPRAPAQGVATAKKPPDRMKSHMVSLDAISGDDEDEATVVAEVPDELRAAAKAEDSHFREVFDKYVTMKKKCGEPVDGLSFDKFAGTLRKNRDQILSKHDAKDVRFTVYEKGGKAALKATPVRP